LLFVGGRFCPRVARLRPHCRARGVSVRAHARDGAARDRSRFEIAVAADTEARATSMDACPFHARTNRFMELPLCSLTFSYS
jgi:hypothetical protein